MRDWFSCAQCGRETGDVIGFDRDNLCFGRKRFDCERDAGEQTATADRHDDGIEIRHLLDDLEAHRSLAGDDRGIVVAVDIGQPLLVRDLVRARFRFGEILARAGRRSRQASGNC